MTQKELIILINRKIKEAKELSKQNHGHNTDSWNTYYSGLAQGLEDAKSIIGMLGKQNKIRNKIIKQEEKDQECKKCGRVFGSVRCFDVDCPNNTPIN